MDNTFSFPEGKTQLDVFHDLAKMFGGVGKDAYNTMKDPVNPDVYNSQSCKYSILPKISG